MVSKGWASALLLLLLSLSGCSDDGDGGESSTTSTSESETESATTTTTSRSSTTTTTASASSTTTASATTTTGPAGNGTGNETGNQTAGGHVIYMTSTVLTSESFSDCQTVNTFAGSLTDPGAGVAPYNEAATAVTCKTAFAFTATDELVVADGSATVQVAWLCNVPQILAEVNVELFIDGESVGTATTFNDADPSTALILCADGGTLTAEIPLASIPAGSEVLVDIGVYGFNPPPDSPQSAIDLAVGGPTGTALIL